MLGGKTVKQSDEAAIRSKYIEKPLWNHFQSGYRMGWIMGLEPTIFRATI